ncbi:MAG: NAD(P)/FAD-dependent oxidoreductase [Oscillospiraceae bacterium]|nr:NAD(P)/FAD-dependent oxidoreductase [Oscillospiraceae bacterium]
MKFDVVIVGAGVTGAMLARNLSRYQLSVCLLEKENDVAMGASKANSGIVHGGYDPEPGTMKALLNTRGVALLYRAAEELNVPCIRNGSMVCAFSQAEEAHLEALLRRGAENNISGLSILSGDEARKIEPHLSGEVTKVLHVPNAGIISPYELTIAAVGNAMDNGVSLCRNFAVSAIAKTEEGFVVTAESGETVTGSYLVNCAGGNADKIAALAGDGFFTLIPRAGEYMLLDKAEGYKAKHTLFQCPSEKGKGILVSPTVHGNLLIGPTAIPVETENSRDTTPEGLAEVVELSLRTVPSVDTRQVITSFTGVRASEKSGDFILQESKTVPGLIHAAAIDSPGLTCCVAIAECLTALLAQAGLSLQEKESWDGTREDICAFREMKDSEKDAYIKENPAYGKIVCRCETVSEGEILRAIHQNPGARDIDGVKRRTRSGMGRCQGGFCGPYIMQLLSRELGIPMEQVTKSGEGSQMLIGELN